MRSYQTFFLIDTHKIKWLFTCLEPKSRDSWRRYLRRLFSSRSVVDQQWIKISLVKISRKVYQQSRFPHQQDFNPEQDTPFARRRLGSSLARHRPSHREDYYIRLAHIEAQLPCVLSFAWYGYTLHILTLHYLFFVFCSYIEDTSRIYNTSYL